MENENQKRTMRMVMLYLMEQLGGPRLKANDILFFDQLADPALADKELTEAEYQFWLQKVREELPAFKRYLLTIPAQGYDFHRLL